MEQARHNPVSNSGSPAPDLDHLLLDDQDLDAALTDVQQRIDNFAKAMELSQSQLDDRRRRLEEWDQDLDERQGRLDQLAARSEHTAATLTDGQDDRADESSVIPVDANTTDHDPGWGSDEDNPARAADIPQAREPRDHSDLSASCQEPAPTSQPDAPEHPAQSREQSLPAESGLDAPDQPNEEEAPGPAQQDYSSMDLDPAMLSKLRVLRRLVGPGKSDAELLAQLQARKPTEEPLDKTKKRWWQIAKGGRP